MPSTETVVRGSGFGIVIPARFGAQRLPGKPLRLVRGKPLIAYVYENALRARADFTLVATDDERIADAIREIGGEVELTLSTHQNGTERLAEVVERRAFPDDTVIVNVQGDEPLLDPELICRVAGALRTNPNADLSTLATKAHSADEIFNPNVVKVVFDHAGYAMYFSRAPIPWSRDTFPMLANGQVISQALPRAHRHWGIYAYRSRTLVKLRSMPPSDNETAEALEQLRALHWGLRIYVHVVDAGPARSIDTEEDLAYFERYIDKKAAVLGSDRPQES